MAPEPEPDPLISFLIPVAPTPPPPRSTPTKASSIHQPPDPESPSQDLLPEGHEVEARSVGTEIKAAQVQDHDDQKSPAPTPSTTPTTQAPDAQHSSPSATEVPSTQLEPQAQAFPQPSSPTQIDPELQERGRTLLPDLARHLNRLKEQRVGIQDGERRSAINPKDPPEIVGNKLVTQCHSEVHACKEGTVNEAAILHSRFSASQKGKQIQEGSAIHGEQRPPSFSQTWHHSSETPGKIGSATLHGASSSRQEKNQFTSATTEEGWEPAKKANKHRETDTATKAFQSPNPPRFKTLGFEFFRKKLEGRCFNCFSTEHIARFCRSSHRCWKCFNSGHRANECSFKASSSPHHKARSSHLLKTPSHKPVTPTSSTERDSRSYTEVVRGAQPMAAMAARYPGDPRARPARGYCAMTATGAIKRRRDDLVSRAVVCWLDTNDHDTETHHLSDTLLGKLHLRHGEFQVVKHYPEQFLVIFRDQVIRQRVLDRGGLSSRGREFHFAPWNERLHATNTSWEFRVKVRIEGIPVHCWAEEVAARALGRSCAVHYLEEKTRRRERTRTFDLWAWCCDPCDIPKEVVLTLTEPDREQPPTSIPLALAPPHHDAPVDLKRAQVFLLRNHLEYVEDLSFLQGHGRMGGPQNRKPRRELVWSYGEPDSVGERLPSGRGLDRGRDMGHHRPDDDDYDYTRRNQGIRRQRSVSSWVRNPRCRSGVEDCISTTRWRGGRSRVASTPHQAPLMVWKRKGAKDGKKQQKKVSFADPIATELKPPKRIQPDDSIRLIKDADADKESSNTSMELSWGAEMIQHALAETLKVMEKTLAASGEDMHFARPIEKAKMDAIQVVIEEGNKRMKKGNITLKMAAQVGLDA